MRKTLLGLLLLAAVGFGAWRFFAPPAASKNPMERMKTARPMETVRVAKPVAPAPVVRSAPAAPSQMTAQRAKMEERFSDLKEEGRRVRETLLASDPKAAQAYNEVVRRPEYRALIDRRHQIEAAWAAAPEKDPKSAGRTHGKRSVCGGVSSFLRPSSGSGRAGGLSVKDLRSPS